MGEVVVHGAYYRCADCRACQCIGRPKEAAGGHKLSVGAARALARCACLESFEKSADSLYELTGLRVCEERSRQVAEDVGKDIGARLQKGESFGGRESWPWPEDAAGHACAYVSIDATGILMQGPSGAKAEGRMPYVAMVYYPAKMKNAAEEGGPENGEPPPGKARYLAGLMSLAELGPQLRRAAAHVGMEEATQWIALSDGGAGLDDFFATNFPQAQRILDFYHAAQHLAELARLVHADDAAQAEILFADWRHQLRHEGGQAFLKTLLNFNVQNRSAAVQDAHRRLLEYVRSNLHRMDYPAYAANGWQIGSGPVESACKMVVNQRLCQGGMRWSEAGGDAICHLRALFRSERTQWAAYWNAAIAA